MRQSIGFGAYDNFGEDIKDPKYVGSTPIRFGRGSLVINSENGEEPKYKSYTFEAGMTPFGILFALTGGAAFVYFIYRVTGSIFGFGGE